MLGILNDTCVWKQQIKNSNTPFVQSVVSELIPCTKGIDTKLVLTDVGYMKIDVQYFILHTDVVKDGDLLDDKQVVVQVLKDLSGTVQGYKAVVCNG